MTSRISQPAVALNRVEKLLLDSEEEIAKRKKSLESLKPPASIYISGICGTATASLAYLLKDLGFKISGSDRAFYPPMGDVIRAVTNDLFEGFSETNFSNRPDFVVVGNTVSFDNPEAEFIRENNIPYASLPEMLEHFLIGSRDECPTSIVCAGTHGKTTTSAAVASVFETAGLEPGFFIGGVVDGLPRQIRKVSDKAPFEKRVVILEGDEYDSAYFAKWSKFHTYRPDILIVTSLEFDHADIYESIEDIKDEFTAVVSKLPESGTILLWDGSEELRNLAEFWDQHEKTTADIQFYGEDADSTYRLVSRAQKGSSQELELDLAGEAVQLETKLSGSHNALNLLAVSAASQIVGLSSSEIVEGVAQFQGVRRRQQVIFDQDEIKVIEDFAHHPTAVRLTLDGIKESHPGKNIIVLFEPRSNTSRRSIFQEDYAKSFSSANQVLIKTIEQVGGYSKYQTDVEKFDEKKLATDLNSAGIMAEVFSDVDLLLSELQLKKDDLVLIMSNGAFAGLPEKLVGILKG